MIELRSARLILRTPRLEDADARRDFYLRNATHLAPWSTPRPAHWHDLDQTRARIDTFRAFAAQGRLLPFHLYEADAPGRIVGTCNFDQISRGAFRSCMLGYELDAGCVGRGYMTEALRCAIDYVFDVAKLHRVQANHMPHNDRSAAVLARLGFVREGLAPKYLFIDGAWRDHVLNALINPRFDDAWMQET